MGLDRYNFYKGVRTRVFESEKILYIIPPQGEFILKNYKINNEFAPPFKIYTLMEEYDYKLELRLKLFLMHLKKHNMYILIYLNNIKTYIKQVIIKIHIIN